MEATEIKRHYDSTMDSVNLLSKGKPVDMNDTEWADCVQRNKEHIKIMLAKDFWTTEDLTPFETAIL
jgi:hypothetical protein